MLELLLIRGMVWIVFAGMRFSCINEKRLETLRAILCLQLLKWKNLSREGRSSDVAKLENDVLPAAKVT